MKQVKWINEWEVTKQAISETGMCTEDSRELINIYYAEAKLIFTRSWEASE